jgi:hypothetical protein
MRGLALQISGINFLCRVRRHEYSRVHAGSFGGAFGTFGLLTGSDLVWNRRAGPVEHSLGAHLAQLRGVDQAFCGRVGGGSFAVAGEDELAAGARHFGGELGDGGERAGRGSTLRM